MRDFFACAYRDEAWVCCAQDGALPSNRSVLNIDYMEVFGVVADKCEAVMEKSFASRIARGEKVLVTTYHTTRDRK